jgi:uncharacterized protein (DUF488 family)
LSMLFTLGYEKRSIDEFVRLLLSEKVNVLVDVRETAWSHKPGFSKRALEAALASAGIDYVHAAFAGNPKRLRVTARSHEECLARYGRYLDENPQVFADFSRLLAELHRDGKSVCVTCFERHPGDCHRGILATRWEEKKRRKVSHIEPGGCPRLVPA